jgi:hypothetical protein
MDKISSKRLSKPGESGNDHHHVDEAGNGRLVFSGGFEGMLTRAVGFDEERNGMIAANCA